MSREQRFYSIIIPLYNRPQEITDLLDSLTRQLYPHFEVIVVDDGSVPQAYGVINTFAGKLDLQYIYQENRGQGFARNHGFQKAKGDYFVVFDSDCLIPKDYLLKVESALENQWLDAYGGPDMAHSSFTNLQKAISYAMTSPLSTGGIRGNKKHLGTFHPRSFNMGISRETWERTGGFHWTNQSEDMEFSIRMQQMGLRVGLIADAGVYHKRRVSLRQFFNQTFSFGQGRVRLFRHFGSELKPVHCLPSIFTIGLAGLMALFVTFLFVPEFEPIFPMISSVLGVGTIVYSTYFILLFLHALVKNSNLHVAALSVLTVVVQFIAYGSGFLKNLIYNSSSSSS